MFLSLFCLVNPLLGIESFETGLSISEFLLLSTATIFIAIGGNILNDIEDINPDSINKKGKNPVGKKVSVSAAWNIYYTLNLLGIASGTLLSWQLGKINYSLIFLISAGLLWFYSKKYQHQVLLGNIVVAVLSAISFGIVWLFQFFALSRDALDFSATQANFNLVNRMILTYMAFAFLLSLIREIIKDAQDIKGDDRFGSRTLAVVYGLKRSALTAAIVAIFAMALLTYTQIFFFNTGQNLLFYYFFIIDALSFYLIYKLFKSEKQDDFGSLSKMSKLIMALGVLSMISFYFAA